jgi:hypothetical protein
MQGPGMSAKRVAPILGAKYAAVVEFVSKPTVDGMRQIAIEKNGVLFGALWCFLAEPNRLWYGATLTGAERVFDGSMAFHSAMLWAEREADKPEVAAMRPALASVA